MTPAFANPVVVLCAGGHAKVLIAALQRLKADILGITDADPAKRTAVVLGVPVLGGDEVLEHRAPGTVLLVNGMGTVDRTTVRRSIFDRFAARGFQFASVVDPLAHLAGPIEIGEGAQVLAGAVIQPGTRIGANTIVNTRAGVDHDCVLGMHVHIAPGATLSGGVFVDDGAHVGTGASVIHNVRIGTGSIIGAGAAVTGDIPDGVVAAGVPARIIRKIA